MGLEDYDREVRANRSMNQAYFNQERQEIAHNTKKEFAMQANELGESTVKLGEVESYTQDNIKYDITHNANTGYGCTCVFNQTKHKECKHIKEFRFNYRLEQEFFDLEKGGFITFQAEGALQNVTNHITDLMRDVYGKEKK